MDRLHRGWRCLFGPLVVLALALAGGRGAVAQSVGPAPSVHPTPTCQGWRTIGGQLVTGCQLSPGTGSAIPVVPAGGSVASSLAAIAGRVITPLDFGAVGNGTTDDTAAVQACVNTSATYGWPCRFDGIHKYLITAAITSTGSPVLLGATPPLSPYSSSCPAGLVVNSNIDALDFTGPTAHVSGLCIQMATAAGTRTSGVAIAAGATATTQQGNVRITNNTIIFPYDGIDIGGPTTGTTQTNNDMVLHNLIISPSDRGIGVGIISTNGSTNGPTLVDNQIDCFSANSASQGIEIRDAGGAKLDNGPNGPYLCDKGTVVDPGTGQLALGTMSGVLGDSSLANDLLFYNNGGAIFYWQLSQCWASSVTSGDLPVDIDAGAGSYPEDITFNGCIFHSGGTGTISSIMNIVHGSNITLTGNHIVADDGTTVTSGVDLDANAAGIGMTGNFFGAYNGSMTSGVTVASGSLGNLCIANNDMAVTGTKVVNNSTQSITGACD